MFDEHVGDTNSWHNQAWRKSLDLLNQRQCIQTVFEKQTVRQKMDYRVQLNASIDCTQFLAKQGLAFHGHDESESFSNKGNFLENLRFLGDHNEFINNVILDKAPQNLRLTSPDTQKDIVNAAAKETTKEIIAELGDDLFAVLIDKSRDISFKEQMAVIIRFVNNRGLVVERFLDILNVACASCKRRDRLREKRRIEMVEAISHYEALNGRGLNQETSLICAGDTLFIY